ncbi:MAG TPA: hypothetical protein VGG27_15455 [Magnetospirillaceae bacterium]|jgi:hypothetical protein
MGRAASIGLAIGFAVVVPRLAIAAEDAATPPRLPLFGSVEEARHHCPNDTVIRIDLPEGFYLHGDRGIGGASLDRVFVCRDEAQAIWTAPHKPSH